MKNIKSKPNCIIYVEEIVKVENNFKGKKNHFNIKLNNDKSIHIKHDDFKIKEVWVQALLNLSNFYRSKKIGQFNQERQYKEDLDVKVFNRIMREKERKL